MLINNILETNRIKRRKSNVNINSETNLIKNIQLKNDPKTLKQQTEIKENKTN